MTAKAKKTPGPGDPVIDAEAKKTTLRCRCGEVFGMEWPKFDGTHWRLTAPVVRTFSTLAGWWSTNHDDVCPRCAALREEALL